MNSSLKKIVFKKLNQDLSKVEIIVAENKSIWFIDRANKYWYFEFEKTGKLWWRYEFFTDFFILFSMEVNDFQPLLSEWVEGVLNSRVSSTPSPAYRAKSRVEGVLNSRVSSTPRQSGENSHWVEEVLNHGYRKGSRKVDEVLNTKITETNISTILDTTYLNKVLNREVNMTVGSSFNSQVEVEDILNPKVVSILSANLQNELIHEIESVSPLDTAATDSVDEVSKYKVTRTIPDLSESLTEIDILLNQ